MEWILSAAHWFASAVCHQFPEHSYHVAGVPLPLCARCTGLYLGALLTMIFHTWRHPRAMGVPRPWILFALVLFFFAWAGDGVNSFAATFSLVPHLYPPQNILRLVTGTLMGITIGSLVFIVFNSMLWRAPNPDSIFATRREFFALLGLSALLVLVVHSEFAPLLYPLNLAILIAILVLHTTLVTAFIANLTRPALNWRQALPAFALGALIALTYLSVIAWLRALLLPMP
ncbi:MAG: DUF2085 domain-containing protein [Anaerolineales bacterium]|nr:DUF2085 domain-containing protein [Anaerolineales bacterium]